MCFVLFYLKLYCFVLMFNLKKNFWCEDIILMFLMYVFVEIFGIFVIGYMFCVWLVYLFVGNIYEYKLLDVIIMESFDSVYFM